jgi:NADP-reducing hydrogenase subunit HndB
MPRLSREDFQKMREEAKKGVYLREGQFRGKVVVHMGTCGIAAGARGILASLVDTLHAKGVTDVSVTTSGCAGLCSMEPMMTVEMKDEAPVKYGKLTAEKARRVFEEHVLGGHIATEYALGVGSERAG